LFKLVISKNCCDCSSAIPEQKILKKTLKVDFFENNREILNNHTTMDSNLVLGTSGSPKPIYLIGLTRSYLSWREEWTE
ncbi:MAG: hypothetical protein ACKO90_16475, partial [Microcystis panniformis]